MDKMQKKEVSNFGCASFISLIIGVVYLFIGIKYLGLSKSDEAFNEIMQENPTEQTTVAISTSQTEVSVTSEISYKEPEALPINDMVITEDNSEDTATIDESVKGEETEEITNNHAFLDYLSIVDQRLSMDELYEVMGDYETCYYNDVSTWLVYSDCPVRVFICPGYDETNDCIPDDAFVMGILVETRMCFSNYGDLSNIIIGETTLDELESILNTEIDLEYVYFDDEIGDIYMYDYYMDGIASTNSFIGFYFNSDNVIISADYY